MDEADMPLELVRVAAHEDGWSVRLADDGSLISVQHSEEEANEIADLLTFKLAVDRNLPLSTCLLRVPGSTADFLHAEEALRDLSWEEFLSNLVSADGAAAAVATAGEASAEQEGEPPPKAAALTAAAAPTYLSSSQTRAASVREGEAEMERSGSAGQQALLPPVQQHQHQHQQGCAAPAIAPAAVGQPSAAGAAQPPGPANLAFSPPAKLLGCYRPHSNSALLSVQVSVKDPVTGREKSTYFGGGYSVPAAAGMARDVARLWMQRQRGEPLERVNLNFPLSLYLNDADLMASVVGAADVATLKAAIMARFMSAEGQQAAAAAAAAAGVSVPPPPATGDVAPAPAAGKRGKKSSWQLLPDGGAQKRMSANCQNALCISDLAWDAIFGPNATASRIQLQLDSGEFFHVNAGHAQDRGRPLGRSWREVAQAMQLLPGDTLILRRAAGPAGHGHAGAAGEPRALASVIRSSVPAPAAVAAGGASTAASPPAATAGAAEGGGGGGATPLAGRKRAADEAGLLLRSPGGTIRQLCVDKMLAAARAKQGREASPQQHQPAAQVQPQHVQVKQERREVEEDGQRQQQQQQLHCVPAELQATQQTDRERVAPPAAAPLQQQPGQQQPLLPAPVGHGQNESGAGRRLGGGGGRLPAAPAALHGPAIMVPDGVAGEAAGAPAQPSPYELYSRMKPAVMACGLPAASRHAYFHAFLHMDRSTQRIHCDEVLEMAEEQLLDQLRQFLEAELAARGAAPAALAGPPAQTVSTLSGGTASGLQGAGGVEQRASSRP